MQAVLQRIEPIFAANPSFNISVNVSGVQFLQGDVDKLIDIVNQSSIPNHCVEWEITETFLVERSYILIEQLGKIQQAGIKLAIDDFGVGYSSLAYLKRFNVDTLKIDRMLITDIVTSQDDLEIVKATIAMGHSLGLKVVAEGVEEQQQAELLRDVGCDIIQGFLFSRPEPIDKFLKSCDELKTA